MVDTSSPRTARPRHQRTRAGLPGLVLGLLGLASIAPALFASHEWPLLVHSFAAPLAYLGAALLLTASSFLAARFMEAARRRPEKQVTGRREPLSKDRRGGRLARLRQLWPALRMAGRWALDAGHLATGSVFAVLSMGAVGQGWALGTPSPPVEVIDLQIFGGMLLVAAFPLLVLERFYASSDAETLAEAPQIDRLLRVSLFVSLALGLEAFGLSVKFVWAQALGMIAAGVVVAVALEILLRCAASFFLPTPARSERKAVVDSALAGLLRLSAPRFRQFGIAVKHQFGIDLSRSWALAYIQRALVPLLGGTLVFIWLLTGITAVGVSERAVYERLGVPTQVLHPGLHAHLPWPLGRVRRVEYGVIRELPLVAASGERDSEGASALHAEGVPPAPAADGPAHPEDDRLWTSHHPAEGTYLIASAQGEQQGFQAVNADLTVVYRLGLSDEAARLAVYSAAEPETLVRAIASRLLSRHFARYTLQDVLGQNRQALADNFRQALQDQLDELDSGIETIAVIVEAIHPPSGAAAAYHDVQAWHIRSQAHVAQAQERAIGARIAARREATASLDQARGTAEELIRQAETEHTLFASERIAFEKNRAAYTLERWFEKLSRHLGDGDLLVIDHRLSGRNAPTLDLRLLSPMSSDPTSAPPPSDGGNGHH